jgi:hypothetical protein
MERELTDLIRKVIKMIVKRANKLKEERVSEVEDAELMTGLENALRVMTENATEMVRSLDVSKGLVEAQHWAKREKFCSELIELIVQRSLTTTQKDSRNEGSTLGQSNALLYGGRHGPPWKGRATPLVPAGKAGARGSEQISSDCSQSVFLSHLPTGINLCASQVDLSQAHESAVPSSSSCLEGRVENHDRELPMVTSALVKILSIEWIALETSE